MLACTQQAVPGHLGRKVVANGTEAVGLIYFKDRDSVELWKNNRKHVKTKASAMNEHFYDEYDVSVTEIHSRYGVAPVCRFSR